MIDAAQVMVLTDVRRIFLCIRNDYDDFVHGTASCCWTLWRRSRLPSWPWWCCSSFRVVNWADFERLWWSTSCHWLSNQRLPSYSPLSYVLHVASLHFSFKSGYFFILCRVVQIKAATKSEVKW